MKTILFLISFAALYVFAARQSPTLPAEGYGQDDFIPTISLDRYPPAAAAAQEIAEDDCVPSPEELDCNWAVIETEQSEAVRKAQPGTLSLHRRGGRPLPSLILVLKEKLANHEIFLGATRIAVQPVIRLDGTMNKDIVKIDAFQGAKLAYRGTATLCGIIRPSQKTAGMIKPVPMTTKRQPTTSKQLPHPGEAPHPRPKQPLSKALEELVPAQASKPAGPQESPPPAAKAAPKQAAPATPSGSPEKKKFEVPKRRARPSRPGPGELVA